MLISTQNALLELCQELGQGEYVAVDTEFMREKNYYARLCLIQVANDEVVASIDPIALKDLRPLWDVLFDPKILKVFHAARQDLEIIRDLTEGVPAPLFDTQIAATVAGYEDSISYARLVEELCGERLDKTLTRTDWSRRPLDPAQIRYAEDDVRFLRPIFKTLYQNLKQTGRLDWVREDFERLADPSLYMANPREMFRRIKKGQLLRPRQLAVLRELAAWRETTAMRLDKPRKWILDDDILFEIARHCPDSLPALARMRGLNDNVVHQFGQDILHVVAKALILPEAAWPLWHERRKLKASDMSLLDLMSALVRQRSVEHGVAPQVLGSRPELEALLANEEESAMLTGWRARLVGHELKMLLEGKLCVWVRDGNLHVEAATAPSQRFPSPRACGEA